VAANSKIEEYLAEMLVGVDGGGRNDIAD